jgi:hypothetical protein
MPDPEPFDQFLARTASAQLEPHLKALRASPAAEALDLSALAAEFEKMKKHHAELYRGVKPVRSFFDAAGHVVDCIPFDQQPSVRAARAAGIPVHEHMPPPPHLGTGHAHPQDATESKCQTPPSGQQGPSMCPPGSVMMRRVLLEDLVRAGTLENYFRKEPLKGGGGEPAAKTTT